MRKRIAYLGMGSSGENEYEVDFNLLVLLIVLDKV